MAYVMAGRLAINKGRAAADVEAALASYERVPRLFPGSEAVGAANFYAGNTLWLVRRTEEALDRYRRVTMEYPRSIWAARATLAEAVVLVQTDRAMRALEELQRVRQQFPGTPEAATALNYNTIIYRLYVRAAAAALRVQRQRTSAHEAAKFRDVVGVSVNDAGLVMLGHKTGVAIFDSKATIVKSVTAEEPSAFFVDEKGRVVTVRRDSLVAEGGDYAAIAIPQKDGKLRPADEIPAVIPLSNGDRLVSDRKGKAVIRVGINGKILKNFATLNAERIVMNQLEDVAMLDKDTKSVVITDRDGKQLNKIVPKGTGYELDNPVDIAFDPFGNLYVLDRGKPFLYVFSPKAKLLASFTHAREGPGSFPKPQAFGPRRRRPRLSVRRSIPADSGVPVMSIRKIAVALVLVAAMLPARLAIAQAVDPQFTEAKRLFDALDYDAALRALDLAITGLEAKAVNDPARRELLPAAHTRCGRGRSSASAIRTAPRPTSSRCSRSTPATR